MIVDDQQREIDGIAHMLKWDTLGIEVAFCAMEAKKAIEIIENEKVDIVLTDTVGDINLNLQTIGNFPQIILVLDYLEKSEKHT